MTQLELRSVSKFFGGLAALRNLDLKVNSGEIVALIGPNGAGKTTTFNVVTGELEPSQGTRYTPEFRPSAFVGTRTAPPRIPA